MEEEVEECDRSARRWRKDERGRAVGWEREETSHTTMHEFRWMQREGPLCLFPGAHEFSPTAWCPFFRITEAQFCAGVHEMPSQMAGGHDQ